MTLTAEGILQQLPPEVQTQVEADLRRFTPEQLQVAHAVVHTSNLVVSSTAGSGKSTVLRTIVSFLSRPARIGVFAFNGSIARDIAPTLPDDLVCSTFHAYGRSLIERHSPRRLQLVTFKRSSRRGT